MHLLSAFVPFLKDVLAAKYTVCMWKIPSLHPVVTVGCCMSKEWFLCNGWTFYCWLFALSCGSGCLKPEPVGSCVYLCAFNQSHLSRLACSNKSSSRTLLSRLGAEERSQPRVGIRKFGLVVFCQQYGLKP